ncbi:diiron oxygenase, partial [Burkholderia pseudomallei]
MPDDGGRRRRHAHGAARTGVIMDAYRSPFDDWHQAASVRSMPADAW